MLDREAMTKTLRIAVALLALAACKKQPAAGPTQAAPAQKAAAVGGPSASVVRSSDPATDNRPTPQPPA